MGMLLLRDFREPTAVKIKYVIPNEEPQKTNGASRRVAMDEISERIFLLADPCGLPGPSGTKLGQPN